MIEIIEDNILNSQEQYIGHQANCKSRGGAAGVARVIFDKFTYADCYKDRTEDSIPGTIDIRGNGLDKRYIINCMGQLYPGTFNDNYSNDSATAREQYFYQCLLKIAKIKDLKSIAFPYLVGCAIAGGDWDTYFGKLKNFAKYVEEKQNTKVVLYKLGNK